jgi:hypothetical protein
LAYCDECPLTFATSASLKRHIQASHPKMTPDFPEMFNPDEDFSKDTILEIQTFDDVSQISLDPSNEIYFKESATVCDDNEAHDDVKEGTFIISGDVIPNTSNAQFLLRTVSGDELVNLENLVMHISKYFHNTLLCCW